MPKPSKRLDNEIYVGYLRENNSAGKKPPNCYLVSQTVSRGVCAQRGHPYLDRTLPGLIRVVFAILGMPALVVAHQFSSSAAVLRLSSGRTRSRKTLRI